MIGFQVCTGFSERRKSVPDRNRNMAGLLSLLQTTCTHMYCSRHLYDPGARGITKLSSNPAALVDVGSSVYQTPPSIITPRKRLISCDSKLVLCVVCSDHCSAYPYYGTQYSTECWCGDENADYGANGASNECVVPCAGDASEMCGGSYSMSVYQNEVEIPVHPAYRGCYSDPGTNRVFVQDDSSDEMTAEVAASCGLVLLPFVFHHPFLDGTVLF
ncbi:unnamed protein product [Ectocarpus sp. CCAP 1310/34]|nr:unnamed protein product [Ectocarpus sp. CCAP 1310/34]